MQSLGELRLEAAVENLRTVSYFVHALGERLDLTEKTLFEIELAVDEAVTNIVKHAYPDGEPGLMMIAAEMLNGTVRITLTDWGEPLDPKNIRPFDLDAPIETRIKGGMGLYFINHLMDTVTRTTSPVRGGPNTLTLMKRIETLKPGAHRTSTTRELNAMLNVSEVMTLSTDLDHLLSLIVNELVSAIDAERGTLYLIDEKTGQLFSHVLLEESGRLHEIRLNIGEGIAGKVAASGRIMNIRDCTVHPDFNPVFDERTGLQSRTMLVAPMHDRQGKIIGVVQLINKRDDVFTARDERLLTAMTAQAAISVENARLYAEDMQRQLLNQELETARAIQKSFLPQEVPQHRGWDIAAYWHPMREVAGDFYDFFILPDDRLAVVVADVSGKGVPAALFMALSVTVLRFAMGLNFTPAEMLNHANTGMVEGQQSKMFTTAFVTYIDFDTGEMQFASAGHNPPLLYRAEESRIHYLMASGVAMGVFREARFVEERITIGHGDVLVLYTDGITEIINDQDEEFGEERLESVVLAYRHEPAQMLVDRIMEAVMAFAGGQGVFDDETLVVVKRDE